MLVVMAVVCPGPAQAATIYLCRAYNGASFYAADLCSNHQAFIDTIEHVADVPFAQQVQQAQQAHSQAAVNAQAQANASDINIRCVQLANEKRQIESRYSNWQWQPPEVINPDQKRQRGIDSELRRNGCAHQ